VQKELAQAHHLPRNRAALEPAAVERQNKFPQIEHPYLGERPLFAMQEGGEFPEVPPVGLHGIFRESLLYAKVVEKAGELGFYLCFHGPCR
jgi:hypothetical protein